MVARARFITVSVQNVLQVGPAKIPGAPVVLADFLPNTTGVCSNTGSVQHVLVEGQK
jgi:hypothetical protein